VQAYKFNIEYVKGTNNIVADALSRRPCINTISNVLATWKYDIIAGYAKDPLANKIFEGRLPSEE
jgi:hypothetical protein